MHNRRDRDPYREREKPETMDPDCAICSSPALAQCDCEAKGLDTAVRQAETRMMTTFFADIRAWVRGHAQDYILTYFNVLTTRRRDSHSMHIAHLTERALYYYGTRPHPTEIAAANAELKRGIDEDWRASVQRYPEVLEYFYSLVTFTLPRDDDSAVKDPPLSALTGARMREMSGGGGKGKRQERVEAGRSTPGLGSIRRPPPPPSSGYAYGGRY
ncbi:hypothetical protein V499_05378 [Pseudogymnoascus sp. VKM F-103]|uniref:Uncharacterized protein n=1 Tax=Pseudogymnoascus verrucosus TaxID=342668 RepID=A0A1B8GGG2_9PEZI|nr:uncharacterized protein VE01_07520 [Pseudogymnoascus verrucosus]KFY74631.1 hypothetical protein V499_05378 [Pseudogymnoascus sp. VKM F-103]OBT94927.2 hypothetical protein VE01_07520 [Pseudogymnoascus verrucosus]